MRIYRTWINRAIEYWVLNSFVIEATIFMNLAMFRIVFSFCTLLHLLFSPPPTHQFQAHPSTGVPRVSPCFAEPDSDPCLMFIALHRGISPEAVCALAERARTLYASEDTLPAALYDRAAVAVACLASAGTLRPGPDSDCAACGPACDAESRAEVCALYCTRDTRAELNSGAANVQIYTTLSSETSGNRRSVEKESGTLFDQSLAILLCVCIYFVIFCALLAICLMAIAIFLRCRRLSSGKAERVRGTRVSRYFRSTILDHLSHYVLSTCFSWWQYELIIWATIWIIYN